MPPKKKKSGKKKRSGKKSGRATASNGIAESLNELSREYFLIQIRDLEQRLVRYQKRCDELEVGNGQYQAKFDQLATDKKEIVSFWKKQVEQRTDEIADLNDRLIGLQQAKDTEKESYDLQLQQLRTEFQETKDALTSENMILGGKLSSLEEFKVQKEDLMAKFADLEAQLSQTEQDHKDIIYNLERKAVIDKDRLKKEMVLRVNQVAAEFRKVSNKQMAETTKRTIRENVSINAQLGKMSDKTMELIEENDDVKQKERKHKQQIELLEANEKELAKKNHSNQKIIRMLTEKCRNQEVMIMEYESREQEYEDLEKESQEVKDAAEGQRDEIQALSRDQELLEQQVQETQSELAAVRNDRRKLEKVLTDTATALRVALRKEEPDDGDEDMEEVERRDHMLENLLVLLNSAAAIGVGPQPGELGKQYDIKRRSPTKMPGSGKGIRKGQMSMAPGSSTLPHYQLGDLGLIPRPHNQIPTNFDKTKGLSSTTRLGALRKVLTRSVGIQTVSAPKAMFYADQLLKKTSPASQEALFRGINSQERLGSPMTLGPITSTKKLTSKAY